MLRAARELYDYSHSNMEHLKKVKEPNERHARQELYSIESAHKAEKQYIDLFWQDVAKRVEYTQTCQTPHVRSQKHQLKAYSAFMEESQQAERPQLTL